MNSIKLISLTVSMVLLGMSLTPVSDAHSIHAKIFKVAKLGTIGALGTAAVLAPLAPLAVPLAAVPLVKGHLLKKAVVVGAAGGLLGASLKKPLFLVKSVPKVLGFAPFLKTKKVVPIPIPIPVKPTTTLPPPVFLAPEPVYQPAYVAPPAPVYQPAYVAPLPPAPTIVKSYQQAYLPPPPPPALLQTY